jgi:hypothetical protein
MLFKLIDTLKLYHTMHEAHLTQDCFCFSIVKNIRNGK